jgi:hypothetical protein
MLQRLQRFFSALVRKQSTAQASLNTAAQASLNTSASLASSTLHLLLQEKDMRLQELDKRLQERVRADERLLQEKDTRLQQMQEKDERLLAKTEGRMQLLLEEKEKRLQDKAEYVRQLQATFAKDLSLAIHRADLAEGTIGARAVLEGSLDSIWSKQPGVSRPSTTTQQLAGLLKESGPCSGLLVYLRLAAEDNGVKESELLRQVGKLYDVLSQPVHTERVGSTVHLPVDLFSGRTTLLAFAALASFSGRDLSLYKLGGKEFSLKLRALRGDCTATLKQVRASAQIVHTVAVKEILP